MRNMKKFMPKLMTADGIFFPALLTENSLRLRVMLDMREKTNQFMGAFLPFLSWKRNLGVGVLISRKKSCQFISIIL
jgi:hypothetical protein